MIIFTLNDNIQFSQKELLFLDALNTDKYEKKNIYAPQTHGFQITSFSHSAILNIQKQMLLST